MSEFYTDDEINCTIRKLCVDDYDRGFLQLLEQLTVVNAKYITKEDFARQLVKIISRDGHLILVAVDMNNIIATGTIMIEEKFIHQLGKVGHIEDIVVHSDFQRKGLGKKMINALVRYGKENNCYKVILDCSNNNVEFYEKCGFVQKGVELAKYF